MHTFPLKIINNRSGSREENVKNINIQLLAHTHTHIYIYKNTHTLPVQIVTHFCAVGD